MIGVQAVNVVDNSGKVARKLATRKIEILEGFGNDVQQNVRDLLSESDRASPPYSPPNVHSPEPNLETVEFVVDVSKDSVLVGSIGFNHSNIYPALPGLLHRGGAASIRVRRGRRGNRTTQILRVVYKPRPYMPAAAGRALQNVKRRAKRKLR